MARSFFKIDLIHRPQIRGGGNKLLGIAEFSLHEVVGFTSRGTNPSSWIDDFDFSEWLDWLRKAD